MKKLLAVLTLMSAPAFGGDPDNLLPQKSVTLHATTNAYDACFAVAKLLGPKYQVLYLADLKTPVMNLNLENVPVVKAFDIITAQVNQVWETRYDKVHPGLILIVVKDLPANH